MRGKMSDIRYISERDSDVTHEFEVVNSGLEEVDPPLRPIQQHELRVGSSEGDH